MVEKITGTISGGVQNMQKANMIPKIQQPSNKKSGWFQETTRHSNAAKFGKAGEPYKKKKKNKLRFIKGIVKKGATTLAGTTKKAIVGAGHLSKDLLATAAKTVLLEDPRKIGAQINILKKGKGNLENQIKTLEERKELHRQSEDYDGAEELTKEIGERRDELRKLDSLINEAEEKKTQLEQKIEGRKEFVRGVATKGAEVAGEIGKELREEPKEPDEMPALQTDTTEEEREFQPPVEIAKVGDFTEENEKPKTKLEGEMLEYFDASKEEDTESAFPFAKELEAVEAEGNVFSRLVKQKGDEK